MEVISNIMETLMDRDIRHLVEVAKQNYYDQKLKVAEICRAIDTEIARLEGEKRIAASAKRYKVVKSIDRDLVRLKEESNAWLGKHKKRLMRNERLYKKYRIRAQERSNAHSPAAFDLEARRMCASRGEGREENVTIGNDSTLHFRNLLNPSEAVLDSFEIRLFFHLAMGWMKVHNCKTFVSLEERNVTLSQFIPRVAENGTLLLGKSRRKVYIQLSKDLARYSKGKFDWEATLKAIREDMGEYYRLVLDGEAGDIKGPGTGQVRYLQALEGDIAEFFTRRNRTRKSDIGEYESRALAATFGKGWFGHPENVKARIKLAEERREAQAFYAWDIAYKEGKIAQSRDEMEGDFGAEYGAYTDFMHLFE
jgi:hypothetical protein